MGTKDIKANNALILEFMGVKPKDIGTHWSWSDGVSFSVIEISRNKVLQAMAEYAKYHFSFDWIMPVVFKILDDKNIYAQKRQEVFNSINKNIEITYNAVVEFIQWFNHQQSLSHFEFDENGDNVVV